YGSSFYLNYLARWPDLCCIEESSNGKMMGYIIGKAEGQGTNHHGHITALSIAPEYRRLSLAKRLTSLLEDISDSVYQGYFVDLYVRPSNKIAVNMYEGMGYSVYRTVRDYYGNLGPGIDGGGSEDAYDPQRKSVRANGRDVIVSASSVS
ncbi:7421_t:CDS:2, partial [Acaulospora colombiana]